MVPARIAKRTAQGPATRTAPQPKEAASSPPSWLAVIAGAFLLVLGLIPAGPASAMSSPLDQTPLPGAWLSEAHLFADPDFAPGGNNGYSVASADGLVASGAPGENAVRLYEDSGLMWTEQTRLSPPDGNGRMFGYSVALDETGSTLVVGESSSSVYVYEREGTSWTLMQVLERGETSCLGLAVAIEAGTILAGGPCRRDAAYVFERRGDAWTLETVLEGEGDWFGWSVALEDGLAAVGSTDHNVKIYERSASGWVLQATVMSPAPNPGHDAFGRSIDLQDGWLIVGASSSRESPAEVGAVYVFHRLGAAWIHEATLFPVDLSHLERQSQVKFGAAVAFEEDRLIVGAPGDDRLLGVPFQPGPDERDQICYNVPLEPTCRYPGAAYVFERTSDGWVQDAKLTAPDSLPTETPRKGLWDARPDGFGYSVAIESSLVAVGAPYADVQPVDDAGAAYLFSPAPLGEV